MDTQILIRLIVGLLMTGIVIALAAKRVLWLTKLIRSGQPTSEANNRKDNLRKRITTQFEEVFGQTRLLRWSIPGIAHFFTMWGFFILATVYLEAYGLLFDHDFHIPIVGTWDALGFLQDFFAVAVLLGIVTFAIIRVMQEPKQHGRDSRFYGSHTGGAWLILFMIFNVIWTYALVRGAAADVGNLPYGNGAFFSHFMGWVLSPLGHDVNEWVETIALLAHIAVMLVFLLIVLHSSTCTSAWPPSTSPSSGCPTASVRCCRWSTRASRSTSRIPPRTRSWAAARSRTSPGRAISTSRPAPSAVAASRSARRGTPVSRCHPSS